MHWIAWIGVANLAVLLLEYIYRAGKFASFWQAFPYIIIPILIAQVGIFYGYKSAPTLIYAGIMFSSMAVVLRIGNSYYLGEPITLIMWAALLLSMGAVLIGAMAK